MFCLFCLSETDDSILIFDETEQSKNVQNIISKYFWFELNKNEPFDGRACTNCWQKVLAFHEFYIMVEQVHRNKLSKISERTSLNESLDLSNIDSKIVIKSKTDELESHILLQQATIYIQTPSIIDDSDRIVNSIETSTKKKEREPQTQNDCQARQKCTKRFTLKASKKTRTTKTNRNVQEIICYMCQKQYGTFRGLRYHFHVHDPIDSQIFECDLCSRKFSRLNVMKKHRGVHASLKKRSIKNRTETTCPICKKTLKYGSLKVHIEIVHENKPRKIDVLVCEVCGKECKGVSSFNQHVSIHVDRKLTEIQCDICEEWLKNRHTLRRHKLSKHFQSPQKCPHCDKIKPNINALKQHIICAHSMPKHPCTYCGKAFTILKTLKEHLTSHTGELIYDCPYCPKKFKNGANKFMHIRKHHFEEWSEDRAKRKKPIQC